ncbi:unnamed protein product [Phytophthora lilii]|uniref:Unnamed protein product n=1 Tax=Phytophthora lilii TaxID=2077276 RepID=A0A9W6WQX0_9STRA|nr:unnamed protein product [Phytophthora lilii]
MSYSSAWLFGEVYNDTFLPSNPPLEIASRKFNTMRMLRTHEIKATQNDDSNVAPNDERGFSLFGTEKISLTKIKETELAEILGNKAVAEKVFKYLKETKGYVPKRLYLRLGGPIVEGEREKLWFAFGEWHQLKYGY